MKRNRDRASETVHTRTQTVSMSYLIINYKNSSFSTLVTQSVERLDVSCIVRSVTGSSPSLPETFYRYH